MVWLRNEKVSILKTIRFRPYLLPCFYLHWMFLSLFINSVEKYLIFLFFSFHCSSHQGLGGRCLTKPETEDGEQPVNHPQCNQEQERRLGLTWTTSLQTDIPRPVCNRLSNWLNKKLMIMSITFCIWIINS